MTLEVSLDTTQLNPIELTPQAIEYIKTYLSQKKDLEGKLFRVSVEGGGCSGFQYDFNFDEQKEGDQVIQCGEVQVLLDAQSRDYLMGSIVDYTNDFRGSGFTVKNPNSKGTCGCGVSFTV